MGMLNPMRDKKNRDIPGGSREDTYDHGLWLVQKIAEGNNLL